jgi:ATP-dependent protease HslVU (ClpYQ) peptidase subunit
VTCVIGLLDSGKVYMGSDSATSDGDWITQSSNRKVFRNGDFLFGFTTSWRMGQMLQHAFAPPKINPSEDITAFLCTRFMDGVRKTFKDGGWERKEGPSGAEKGGTFLLGYQGRLFEVCSDFQVAEYPYGYAACGSGFRFALGSLHSTAGLDWKPQRRILTALKAASAFAVGVTAPYRIRSI